MTEFESICPYTGLRPFTEEESLYFKGRDEHINKLSRQLEVKKFLMVTGASGDGKSSLIFAGLIPQARAGFFQARYSNWHVASFRPERSPLRNLAQSLTHQLQMESPIVEVELSRGFSSLIELYKSSPLYLDETGKEWKDADEKKRNEIERKAGNLLIIIDQFEEFFTNPENFPNGVPSQDSRLLLNIILETVKISLKEDLPVYVVCTMRSDFIGQCAAFRGLPEFIGFSQFFVPRLQRKELLQVIEEPAILSGNRITKRLIDRLIFDLEDGLDQLPILQHALKQIWKTADHGSEEMDLVHYAMVGGMPGNELPKEHAERYEQWHRQLSDFEKKNLENPGLSRVLDIHANKLYEEAADYYNKHEDTPITAKEAKFIIGLSFSCLTRIDENRAVRNRMTLEEVTQIINVPKFTTKVVAGVLNIFRESDNTLVRPFLESGTSKDKKSDPRIILDITHEALIRNWALLKKWSAKEFEYYTVYLDFKRQLDRWIESGHSNDYLLPIGPLTYFENWYNDCRPNKYWINRYNIAANALHERLKESEVILNNARQFLRRSAIQLLITRAFMRYGAPRIALVTGIVLLLSLGIYFAFDWYRRQNEVVLNEIVREGATLLSDKEAGTDFKAHFVMLSSRVDPANLGLIAQQVTDPNQKIQIGLKIFERIFFTNKESNPPIRAQALNYSDSLTRLSFQQGDVLDTTTLNDRLTNLNDLIRNELYFLRYQPEVSLQRKFDGNVKLMGEVIHKFILSPTYYKAIDKKALNIGIENLLNLRVLSPREIREQISAISPFEGNEEALKKFNAYFPAKGKLPVGWAQSVSHYGGYEKLAYLYAAIGNVEKTLRCLDSLNATNENYDRLWNNSTNIAGYYLMYEHVGAFNEFVSAYTKRIGISKNSFMRAMVNFAGIEELRRTVKFFGNYNENLALFDITQITQLFKLFEDVLRDELKDKNRLNFELALLYKQQGVTYGKLIQSHLVKLSPVVIDSLFALSVSHYRKVESDFLNEEVEINMTPALNVMEKRVIKRKHLFLYPDHYKVCESFTNPGDFRFYGKYFFDYMMSTKLFDEFFGEEEDYKLLSNWVGSYFEMYGILSGTSYWNRAALGYPVLPIHTFLSIDSLLRQSGYLKNLDDAWINLYLSKHYFEMGDTASAFDRVSKLKFLEQKKLMFTEDKPYQNMKLQVASQLLINGKKAEAYRIVAPFVVSKNKMLAYSKMAAFAKMNGLDSEAKILIDSALATQQRIRYFLYNADNLGFDYRNGLVEALTLENDSKSWRQARELISAMEFTPKLNGALAMVRTQARMLKYYEARQSIPLLANPEDRLRCYNAMLFVEVQKRKTDQDASWNKFDGDLLEWINFTEFLYDLIEY